MISFERTITLLPAALRWRVEVYRGKLRCILRDFRWRRAIQRKGYTANSVRLHIGCGDIDAPGFLNVDARAAPHIDFVTDHLDAFAFIPDNSAQLVYMSHVLEHVPHGNVEKCLRELRRILVPGGVLRISVPDFDLLLKIYEASDHNVDSIQGPLMGGQDYEFNFHYVAFTRASLTRSLCAAGFANVRPWDPQSVDFHDFDDWASSKLKWQAHEFEVSLNLEAVK